MPDPNFALARPPLTPLLKLWLLPDPQNYNLGQRKGITYPQGILASRKTNVPSSCLGYNLLHPGHNPHATGSQLIAFAYSLSIKHSIVVVHLAHVAPVTAVTSIYSAAATITA